MGVPCNPFPRRRANRPCGVTVSTLDSESSDGGSNPPRASFRHEPCEHAEPGFKFRPAVKKVTLVGLEPTISGSVDRCLIHWATGPDAQMMFYTISSTKMRITRREIVHWILPFRSENSATGN
jgi:hypothetical protein